MIIHNNKKKSLCQLSTDVKYHTVDQFDWLQISYSISKQYSENRLFEYSVRKLPVYFRECSTIPYANLN